jgi:hypothetical protein
MNLLIAYAGKRVRTLEDNWEEVIDEEKTIKLPQMLRQRPIWEKKTSPLPLAV